MDANDQTARLDTNLSLDDVAARLEQNSRGVRAFIGYAGWSTGQLEEELAQSAWVLVRPDNKASQAEQAEKLWYQVMNSLGPVYKLQAAAPDDPSLN